MATTLTLTMVRANGQVVKEDLVLKNDAKALAILEAYARENEMDTEAVTTSKMLQHALKKMWAGVRKVAEVRRRAEVMLTVQAQIDADFDEQE